MSTSVNMMLIKFFCVLLCYTVVTAIDIEVAESREFRNDYEYISYLEGWLKFHRVPAPWHEARLRCDLEGAVLASPLNVDLQTGMKAMMEKNDDQQYGVFTGIHATFSPGDYFSIEGVPLYKINISWALEEPDNFENSENCLMLLGNGTMADVKCTDVFPYICYKKASSLALTECGTPDPEYILDNRTGSCYKFHRTATTWSRAYMTCAAEGGYLSIVNSDVESQVLKDIFALHPRSTILSTTFKDDAFIGFQDWGEHGSWRTIHGETLSRAGFNTWLNGNPSNGTHKGIGQHCGGINRSGRLNDLWCDVILFSSICEKNPISLIDADK